MKKTTHKRNINEVTQKRLCYQYVYEIIEYVDTQLVFLFFLMDERETLFCF